jgi:hypothetical protein
MKRFLTERLKDADAFGRPITLTHNGRSSFKTVCGGLCTILVAVLILLYLAMLIIKPEKLATINRESKQHIKFLTIDFTVLP